MNGSIPKRFDIAQFDIDIDIDSDIDIDIDITVEPFSLLNYLRIAIASGVKQFHLRDSSMRFFGNTFTRILRF
jgi:hypothetical protein